MRSIPSYILERLNKNVQTSANATGPSTKMWISRPSTVLVNDQFLERQTVATGSITDVSVAVCHPRAMRNNTRIHIGYISDGIAKVVESKHKANMDSHVWSDTGFREYATAISVAYDGTMPKLDNGDVEFVTEPTPWVFRVNNGMLFAHKLGDVTFILAEENCSDVSAIRAARTQDSTFDFGLVVFFIINGLLYYRQFIRDNWTDAELVSFGPSGVQWSAVSAFRTWDYRVGVQLKSTTGDIYELYTQFMGIGTRNTEHLEITNTTRNATVTTIESLSYRYSNEHIDVLNTSNVAPYQGLYTLGTPNLRSVRNISDGSNNWGKLVLITFDRELEKESVQESIDSFYFVDENEIHYSPISIEMDHTGRKATLTFSNFNDSRGACTMHYEPGTVVTMMGEALPAQSVMFTPTGLTPSEIGLPEVAEILAENDIGTEVSIRFTERIIEVRDGCEDNFTVTINYPEYYPDGKLSSHICPVIDVELIDKYTILLHFEDGVETSIRNAVGEVTVQYMGVALVGEQGPVLDFRETFMPIGLSMRPNPNDSEHIEIYSTTRTSKLIEIDYHYASVPGEHLVVSNTSKVGTLTHIDHL